MESINSSFVMDKRIDTSNKEKKGGKGQDQSRLFVCLPLMDSRFEKI